MHHGKPFDLSAPGIADEGVPGVKKLVGGIKMFCTDKIHKIMAGAISAFAQHDIRNGRLPTYEEYFSAARLAVTLYFISKVRKGVKI